MSTLSLSSALIMRVLSSSVMVVNRAGAIIREIMSKGELGIVEKGHKDLQTEADRSAQMCIVSSLAKQFPKITIIGEETLDVTERCKADWLISDYEPEILKMDCPDDLIATKDEDIVIWVDPLDGTSEYTQGLLDHVTVLVGIAVKGRAVGGVIHQPYFNYKATPNSKSLGRTIWGLIGLGAFGIERTQPPAGQRIITTTRSHSTDAVQAALDAMKPTQVIRVGGAGHKVLLLIEGRAHAYLFASPGCKKWDTCAPEAILRCVGGELTDIHGNVYEYHARVKHKNAAGLIATQNATDHAWYLEQIPTVIREMLPP